jgi:hypothetical protein
MSRKCRAIFRKFHVRPLHLIVSMSLLSASLFATEIRQFDLRTTERLGNDIVRMSERGDRGATTTAKKRAKETAAAVLGGKLYDGVRYDYVILDDPARNG